MVVTTVLLGWLGGRSRVEERLDGLAEGEQAVPLQSL
jgi:hypothetical protein